MNVKIVYDNNKTAVYEGRRLVSKGNSPRHRAFAENVKKSEVLKDHVKSESLDGHKEVFTFTK